MEIKELDEAESLIERGDLKPALKRIDAARNRALGAQNMEAMSRVAAAAAALQAQADGRVLKAAEKQVQLIEQNRQFLARATDISNQDAVSSDAFVARGRNGQLTVTPTKIVISRKGAMGFMMHGHKGEKEIDLHQISAVQFKKNGVATAGYIQFSFLGGGETKRGIRDATKDENTIIFGKGAEANFIRAK